MTCLQSTTTDGSTLAYPGTGQYQPTQVQVNTSLPRYSLIPVFPGTGLYNPTQVQVNANLTRYRAILTYPGTRDTSPGTGTVQGNTSLPSSSSYRSNARI